MVFLSDLGGKKDYASDLVIKMQKKVEPFTL